MIDAIVVGAGPNGLAAAVTLARAGLDVEVYEAQPTVGGGARTLDLGLAPGITHDVCSAVHPLALASPFFREFDLPARGVELVSPEISYAQPLDQGRAALAYRSLARTVLELEADGRPWARLFGPLVRHEESVIDLALSPLRPSASLARAVFTTPAGAGFGRRAARHALTGFLPAFRTDAAAALFTGVTAHASTRLPQLVPSAVGLTLGMVAHTGGWPIPVGGSQAITDALAADLRAHGGKIITDHPIETATDLPPARAYLFDTTPEHVAQVLVDQLPIATRTKFAQYRRASAIAKVDFVINEPVPWAVPAVGEAATVHLGGTQAEMFAAEATVARGQHTPHPMVLVSDPAVVDPSRTVAGLRPLWAYAHVPLGSARDMTGAVTAQIERFAPGFRDIIVASTCTPAAQLAQTNANYIGGDIAAGALSVRRLLTGPAASWNPYATAVPGHYLCSAATPPGPGVHGMAGWHAAAAVLRREFHLKPPSLAPAKSSQAGAGARPK